VVGGWGGDGWKSCGMAAKNKYLNLCASLLHQFDGCRNIEMISAQGD